jgi:hypothetical protein
LQHRPRAQGALRGNAGINAAGETRSKKRFAGFAALGRPSPKITGLFSSLYSFLTRMARTMQAGSPIPRASTRQSNGVQRRHSCPWAFYLPHCEP